MVDVQVDEAGLVRHALVLRHDGVHDQLDELKLVLREGTRHGLGAQAEAALRGVVHQDVRRRAVVEEVVERLAKKNGKLPPMWIKSKPFLKINLAPKTKKGRKIQYEIPSQCNRSL